MEHLDYLHIGDALSKINTRTVFVHDLKLYTVTSNRTNRDSYSVENSLISPWSFLGRLESYNETGNSQTMELRAEVLKARAAYSDMIVALTVVRQLLNDIATAKVRQKHTRKEYPVSPMKEGRHVIAIKEHPPSKGDIFPKSSVNASIQLDGIEILVVDDSMRQFATSQEVISFSVGPTVLLRGASVCY
jgi:hypothetical protein